MAPESKRANMLVPWRVGTSAISTMRQRLSSRWKRHGGRSRQPCGLRSLVALHGQRGDWSGAAACLASASANTSDPQARVQFAFDAAEIYRNRLDDLDGAAGLYSRVLDLSPGHPQAAAVMADITWAARIGLGIAVVEALAAAAEQALEPRARLWQRAGWSAQMTGDVERARSTTGARSRPRLGIYRRCSVGRSSLKPRDGGRTSARRCP